MPVILRNMDDDTAIIMVDSNLQRKNIMPRESAFAYRMKLDAMKHQRKKDAAVLSQVGTKPERRLSVSRYFFVPMFRRKDYDMKRPLAYITAHWGDNEFENTENAAK